MGSIPVLNDNQMNALRRIVGANQTFDLTVAPRSKSRRLPEYTDEVVVSDSEYNGYFKAILQETKDGVKQVKIVNGADPESGICGHTDIGNVNAATLNFEEGKSLYLTAVYVSANATWSLSFVMANNAPNGMYFEIAACRDGKLSQVWTCGTIYFGTRYWI